MDKQQNPVIFDKIYNLLDVAGKISTHTTSIDEKLWVVKDEWVGKQTPDTWNVIGKLDNLLDSLLYSKDILEKIDTIVL